MLELIESFKAEIEREYADVHIEKQIGMLEYWQKSYKEYAETSKKAIRKAVRENEWENVIKFTEALNRRLAWYQAYTEVLEVKYPLGIAYLDSLEEEVERVSA